MRLRGLPAPFRPPLPRSKRPRGAGGRASSAAALCEALEPRQLLAVDIVASSVNLSHQTTSPTQPFTATIALRNAGDERTPPFRVDVHLSRNAVFGDEDDILTGSFAVPFGLAAGETQTSTRSFIVPNRVATGDYFVGFMVDSTRLINETSEINNAVVNSTTAITVQSLSAGGAIEVRGGNGAVIPSGDTSPNTADGTAFGALRTDTGSRVRTFTIVNTGTGPLNISGISIGGSALADFQVVGDAGPLTIPASQSQTFQVRFDPTAAGSRTATVQIATQGAQDNLYTFTVRGRGNRAPATPEIAVSSGGQITDGDTTPDAGSGTAFGSVPLNRPAVRTFTITNTGGGTLNLSGPGVRITGRNAARFALVGGVSRTSLAAGQSATFSIRFTPGTRGNKQATVQIFSNDADEGVFDFRISGVGAPASGR